jgi:chromosome segregation protein
MLGAYAAAGGSAKPPSFIEMQAAVEEARRMRVDTETRAAELREQIESVKAEQATARDAVARAAAARTEAEGQRNAAARRLAELGAAAPVGSGRGGPHRAQPAAGRAGPRPDLAGLTDLEDRLRNAQATPIDTDPSTVERDELASAVPAARQHEIDVRLAVRTAEERVGALSGRADALARQAAEEREARARAEARRAARARGAAIAAAVVGGAEFALSRAGRALPRAGENRDAVARARVGRESELGTVRDAASTSPANWSG